MSGLSSYSSQGSSCDCETELIGFRINMPMGWVCEACPEGLAEGDLQDDRHLLDDAQI